MSRQGFALPTLIGIAVIAVPATAQPVIIDAPPATATPNVQLDVARQLAPRRTRADCIAEAVASGDLIVCAARDDQDLPVPEVYGPQAGSTDGAAVDPRGPPCGASISGHCYTGVGLPELAGAMIGVVSLILDPDRNLGEGDPIPERFRGANR